MRFILVFCLVLVCASPIHAAAPTKSPKPSPISLNIRTAGELANACTVTPTSQASFAQLNFCNGFAQGVLQTDRQNPNGTKICMPNPSPKRSVTMKEFASWVCADVSRKDEVAWLFFGSWQGGSPAPKQPRRTARVVAPYAARISRFMNAETRCRRNSLRAFASVVM